MEFIRYIKETFEFGGNKSTVILPSNCGIKPYDDIEVSMETVVIVRKIKKNEIGVNTYRKKYKKAINNGDSSSIVILPNSFNFNGTVMIDVMNEMAMIRKVK